MKFLCRDLLDSNQLNRVDSGRKLFIALMEKGLLVENDPFTVAELLYRTRQFRLLKKMKYNKDKVCRQLKEPGKAKISSYRQLLFEVSEDITMNDLETVKFFLLESIKTMLDVLTEMEKMDLLEENNAQLLEDICKELGKNLVKKLTITGGKTLGRYKMEVNQGAMLSYFTAATSKQCQNTKER
ncbi:caspase-8-like isoform X2 [Rhincodon typus]|uniref:caspase-8-like isoform X2 n=1 Tax=Rhincodon typus TaxID=259920 RepID=UPI00202EE848|nr:caspase-8-like isoform X2 [Rhincodon typus]